MKARTVYTLKSVACRLFALASRLCPFTSRWMANRLLAGSKGMAVSRVLTLSLDWREEEGCETLGRALRSDVSPRSRKKLKERRMVRGKTAREECWNFLDVSYYWRHDDGTGLHRRLFEQVSRLLRRPGVWRLIYWDPVLPGYRYATAMLRGKFPGTPYEDDDSPVQMCPGDRLLLMQCAVPYGLDLRRIGKGGVKIAAVVDDVIPLLQPALVVNPLSFRKEFTAVMENASLVFSVSKTAVEEIRGAAQKTVKRLHDPIAWDFTYNGCDFHHPEASLSREEQQILSPLASRPYVLSVGSFEPRKAYDAAISAFRAAWKRGLDVSYVMAGRIGKDGAEFLEKTRKDPEWGHRLFTVVGASDSLLSALYDGCLYAFFPSRAEGFGIPLMEAAFHMKPVLARALPVFREVMGQEARFFSDESPEPLAKEIETGCRDVQNGAFLAPSMDKIACWTWDESASKLGEALGRL